MAISVLFSKKGCIRVKWFLKGLVVENENQWETAEIPGWFSLGDFILY
jgi:hypothetical protein